MKRYKTSHNMSLSENSNVVPEFRPQMLVGDEIGTHSSLEYIGNIYWMQVGEISSCASCALEREIPEPCSGRTVS